MNYMPKVLEMLNLEVGEKFKIKGFNKTKFEFTNFGCLIDCEKLESNEVILSHILTGYYRIEKLPWKPKRGNVYYSIKADGETLCNEWVCNSSDLYRYNAGNCFKTKEEITDEIKQRILKEMKGKYEND